MNRISELVKYRIVYPLCFWLAILRMYKTQEIRSNEIRLYNWRVRYFGEVRT